MMRGRSQRGVRARKRKRILKNPKAAAVSSPITDAMERIMWMFKVRDCRHICLFCEYYEKCGLDGIPERGGIEKMNMKYAKRSEDTEQIQIINWAQWHTGKHPELKWLHHIPNGGSRNKLEARKLKEMGVKAGVSDLFLPYPKGCYHGMYIEMKFGNNRHTDKQKEFLADMAETGYFVVTCYSYEDAKKVLEEYVTLPGPEANSIRANNGVDEIIIHESSWTEGKHEMSIPNNSILKDGKIKEARSK